MYIQFPGSFPRMDNSISQHHPRTLHLCCPMSNKSFSQVLWSKALESPGCASVPDTPLPAHQQVSASFSQHASCTSCSSPLHHCPCPSRSPSLLRLHTLSTYLLPLPYTASAPPHLPFSTQKPLAAPVSLRINPKSLQGLVQTLQLLFTMCKTVMK